MTTVDYSSSSMNFQEVQPIFIQDKILLKEISREVLKTLRLMTFFYRIPPVRLLAPLSREALQYLKVNAARTYRKNCDPILYNAPGLILFAGPERLPSAKDDCDIAAVNANLLAGSLELGCCYIGGIPHTYELRKKAFKKAIPLPQGYKVFQAMTIGYPLFPGVQIVRRKKRKLIIL